MRLRSLATVTPTSRQKLNIGGHSRHPALHQTHDFTCVTKPKVAVQHSTQSPSTIPSWLLSDLSQRYPQKFTSSSSPTSPSSKAKCSAWQTNISTLSYPPPRPPAPNSSQHTITHSSPPPDSWAVITVYAFSFLQNSTPRCGCGIGENDSVSPVGRGLLVRRREMLCLGMDLVIRGRMGK